MSATTPDGAHKQVLDGPVRRAELERFSTLAEKLAPTFGLGPKLTPEQYRKKALEEAGALNIRWYESGDVPRELKISGEGGTIARAVRHEVARLLTKARPSGQVDLARTLRALDVLLTDAFGDLAFAAEWGKPYGEARFQIAVKDWLEDSPSPIEREQLIRRLRNQTGEFSRQSAPPGTAFPTAQGGPADATSRADARCASASARPCAGRPRPVASVPAPPAGRPGASGGSGAAPARRRGASGVVAGYRWLPFPDKLSHARASENFADEGSPSVTKPIPCHQ